MAKTYAQRLRDVERAIDDILIRGQEVDVNGRTFTRATIRELREWEQQLKILAAREKRGGLRVRRGVPID